MESRICDRRQFRFSEISKLAFVYSGSGRGNWQSQTHIPILYPSIHAWRSGVGQNVPFASLHEGSAKKALPGVCKPRMYARPDSRKRSFGGRRYRILVGWRLLKITWSLLSAAFIPIPSLALSPSSRFQQFDAKLYNREGGGVDIRMIKE